MSCVCPRDGYFSRAKTSSGKRLVVFRREDAYSDLHVTVPCGKCIGCRRSRLLQWAVRCVHEASMHAASCFVTLTYRDECLPKVNGVPSLRPRDFVLFLKRVRHRHSVRFFQAGEYGKFGRPHHHALLFGWCPDDLLAFRKRGEFMLYRSPELESYWPFGFSSVGILTSASAQYVLKYSLKDSGKEWNDGRQAEYQTMSRRPGIGSSWVEKYGPEVFVSDEARTRDGLVCKVPAFYQERWKIRDPLGLEAAKRARLRRLDFSEQRSSRWYAKSEVMKARARLSRGEL